MSINTITLSGRLTAAPELRYTTGGTAVAGGSIAVDDGYGERKKTYFFEYRAWTHTAEYLAKYAAKGMPVTISGKLTRQTWLNQDGEQRSKTVIVVQEAVLPPKNSCTAAEADTPDCASTDSIYGEEIVFEDSDLPF